MNTIIHVINEFYESEGNNCVLIFHCSAEWGNDKKLKRAARFDEWFKNANAAFTYKKYNEEIVINENVIKNGLITTDKEYLSLIMHHSNSNSVEVLEEFEAVKNYFIAAK